LSGRPARTPLATCGRSSIDRVRRLSTALNLAECRRIIGPGCPDSDEEILAARDALTALAHAVLEHWEEQEHR
jgi:hypothetical protein